jgi:hypothetical protein
MQNILEGKYCIGRALALGHPAQFQSIDGIHEFLAFFRGALISYAKCFVSAGAGRMRLDESEVLGADAENLAKHNRLMELRNKYVAHCDENDIESAAAIHEEDTPSALVVRLQYSFSFPFDRLYELRDLIDLLEAHIVDRHRSHLNAVRRELGKPVRIVEE